MALVAAAALGAAAWLKLYYHGADFDHLRWLIDPSAHAAGALAAATFELEAHHGWLAREARFEIVPACAGMNFLIIAFLSVVAAGLHRTRSLGAGVALLAAAFAAASVTTVLANAVRIAIALRMHEAALAIGPLTPDRLHRAEGVIVFFGFLLALFAGAGRVARGRHADAR